MSDRIIRDELWQSIRWLDLPTDTHRLVYISLLPIADDYGNVEGGPRRIYRWMHGFTQIKTEADSIKLMSDLQDVDLARRYEVDGKEYWHLPRFRNSRRYWSRKFPKSPFKEQENQETVKNTSAALAQTCVNPSGGVGVGVGVGVKETPSRASARKKNAVPLPQDFEITEPMAKFAQELGLNGRFMLSETEKFLDHARANDRRQVNWKAAWRNWMRTALERQRPKLAI